MRVSIIINNFNYACFLNQAIDSALNQTHRNTEVIVVDDGSTDSSLTVLESVRRSDQSNCQRKWRTSILLQCRVFTVLWRVGAVP